MPRRKVDNRTPEEKRRDRQRKNRQAAQSSRDKKAANTKYSEMIISALEVQHPEILEKLNEDVRSKMTASDIALLDKCPATHELPTESPLAKADDLQVKQEPSSTIEQSSLVSKTKHCLHFTGPVRFESNGMESKVYFTTLTSVDNADVSNSNLEPSPLEPAPEINIDSLLALLDKEECTASDL